MEHAELRVVEGPDRGARIELPLGARLLLGRGDEADLRLNDANVSRRHCAVEHSLAGVFVEDLGSTSGTLLDGARVNGGGPVRAPHGADLRLGGTRLQVLLSLPREPLPALPGVEVIRHLGEGASGSVFEARLPDGTPVALKLLAADADEVTRRRFEREAELRDRLEHPAIARVLRLARLGGRPCLLRELVPGRSLANRLAEGPLSWVEALELGVTVAGALAHAHERGVVHRDVKPQNIILDERGRRPTLIDFDLALRSPTATSEELTRLTRTGEGLGTLSYLAPEQLTQAHAVDPRADVYGLGLTLYHAVTGQRPFADVPPEEFLEALARRGPAPLRSLAPRLPSSACEALERAYAPTPADRYPSARAFAMRLTQVLAGR
ncbi:MAG: FHA domain-containing protein [Planctomycetota bacterium]|nr:MAG: FHA domain-containing protein [Planctomycetota bacterium]